jgi:hypothetical protein
MLFIFTNKITFTPRVLQSADDLLSEITSSLTHSLKVDIVKKYRTRR